MRVGVVDVGTNSMRLLIADDGRQIGRWVEVTGLGRGVDGTGLLGTDEVERTIECLTRYGSLLDRHGVTRRAAIATSATRDAANREEFLDRAEKALGVRPETITGDREARLAHAGATSDLDPAASYVVCDIGGGSTEFVSEDWAISVDIGSVRLTERTLPDRPASPGQLEAARGEVAFLFSVIEPAAGRGAVGVAGTWTSLAAIDLDLALYDPIRVHHHRMSGDRLEGLVTRLARMTVKETAAIPSLDPGRAPVILAGAVIAAEGRLALGVDQVLISERDTLDGLAMELAALP